MEGNAVRKHLIGLIRQRLAENGLSISDESLEYTAERYAWMIMDRPSLSVSKLLDRDIARLRGILKEVDGTPKAG